MRLKLPLLAALLASGSIIHADVVDVGFSWIDNFNGVDPPDKPITDNSGVALQITAVVQIGYFEGVDPQKDPATYTPADWASFVPVTGNGSLNPTAFPLSLIGAGGAPPGYTTFGVRFDTEAHNGIPTSPVRIGVRFFNADTSAGSTHYNTVSAGSPEWILPAPVPIEPPTFNQAIASMDAADLAGTLAWEGTPFRTDLVPGVVAPDLVLTSVTLLNATTLEIAWSGGDGSNDIQTSTNGTSFSTVSTGQVSPTTITINTATTPTLLVRVIEP